MRTRSAPARCDPISYPARRSAPPAGPVAPPGWPGTGRRSPARSRLRNRPWLTSYGRGRHETVTALPEEAAALGLVAEGTLAQLARVARDLARLGVQVDGGLVDLAHR